MKKVFGLLMMLFSLNLFAVPAAQEVFNARLLNDMKDIVDVDVEKMNLDVSLPLDELDAPYLLYFNENCELSKFFVFEKGNGECSYSFLDSLNVKK